MWITIKAVYDIETLQLIESTGYEYTGPVDLACSSGGQVAQTDEALQQSQAALNKTLAADYGTTFAEQQSVLGNITARMNYMAANPMGYSPRELKIATTSINENFANAAKKALGSAASFAAAHGASDIGGGGLGLVAGDIASQMAGGKAQALASLSDSNEKMKQQNFWNAIQGLNSASSQYGGSSGQGISGANAAADSAVSAGSGALAAQQASWQNTMGMISGIGGLATAGAGIGGNIAGGRGSFA